MEFSPQKFREIVFQLLFSFDGNGGAEEELIPFLMQELSISRKQIRAAYQKASAVWRECQHLDPLIASHTKEYALDRIKTVEKNALRLALYELRVEKEISRKIVISEAYRITRKFSTAEGAAFVNAVLDSLPELEHESPFSLSESNTTQ